MHSTPSKHHSARFALNADWSVHTNYNTTPPTCYFVYIDVGALAERTLIQAKSADEIREMFESQFGELKWRRAKYDMVFRRRRQIRMPARYR